MYYGISYFIVSLQTFSRMQTTHLMRAKSKENVQRFPHTTLKRFFFFVVVVVFHVNVICSMYPDQPAHSGSSCENGLGQCTTSICKERSVKVDLWCMVSI